MIPTDSTSKRKPYNHLAGYKASRHNLINNGWVVIYDTHDPDLQDFYDRSGGRWLTICELHDTLCNHTSLAIARSFLKYPEFCEECMEE